MLFEAFFRKLQAKKVKYLVVGGIAVNLHGFQRATGDLDILISMEEKNIQNFIQVAKSLHLKPHIPVKLEDFADEAKRRSWVRDKGLKVFLLYDPDRPMEHFDILLDSNLDFDKAFKKKFVVKADGLKIYVSGVDDLIRLKTKANRERDKIDIQALRQIQRIQRGKKD